MEVQTWISNLSTHFGFVTQLQLPVQSLSNFPEHVLYRFLQGSFYECGGVCFMLPVDECAFESVVKIRQLYQKCEWSTLPELLHGVHSPRQESSCLSLFWASRVNVLDKGYHRVRPDCRAGHKDCVGCLASEIYYHIYSLICCYSFLFIISTAWKLQCKFIFDLILSDPIKASIQETSKAVPMLLFLSAKEVPS